MADLDAGREPGDLRQLWEAARTGQRHAQAELLRQLQDPLYRFCLSQLREPHAAEEATQEVAVRLLGSLSRFQGRSSVKTWALGFAMNVCREFRRGQSRQIAWHESPVETPPPVNPLPDELAQQRESARRLTKLLDTLPARQREAIVLRYFEDLSMEETAQVMQCAVGTVKATVWQALRNLRGKLELVK